MFLSYERSLQPDLVGAGIIVPIAGAKWPFGVIGNPQINFKQISTPVRYHPRII
jgi:hypothetical protein